MNWIVLVWLPFVAGCRMTKFLKEEGVALKNHVVKTVDAAAPVKCHWDCVDMPLCFSINVQKLPTGWVTCDLNNSSKTANPQDLIQSEESQYHQMGELDHCTTEQCIHREALPDDWYRFGTKLLKLFPEIKTWEQAVHYCRSIGGELVSINSKDENEFISRLFTKIETGHEPNQTIGHWTLDGTDPDVSLFNGATYEKEDNVNCLYLDGSGAYATTPAVNFGRTSLTIASWVKLQSPVDNRSPIYSRYGDPHHFLFDYFKNKQLRFVVANNKGTYEPSIRDGSVPIDKWFHAAAVWDRKVNKAFLFIDGQKAGTQDVASDIYFKNNSYSVYDIGLNRQQNNAFKGRLRDLIVIGRALTGEELANLADPVLGVWIGLNDIISKGTYHWPDSTHVTYSKWGSNQPDNKNNNQDCVRMTLDGGAWDDTNCVTRLPFICEKNF